MSDNEKYTKLQRLFWDYNITTELLNIIIDRQFEKLDKYTHDLIFKRMLERLDWYDILDIAGVEQIKKVLHSEMIQKLRNKELKVKYEKVRQILFGEPLPSTGWDTDFIKRVKSSVLSDRWYCSK